MTSFILNDQLVRTEERPGTVLLEFIRGTACLSGTKEACREGECGACTVLIGTPRPDGTMDYRACASCLLPLGDADGRHVVTVEGLSSGGLTLVQRLIVENSASQCGFCTPGIVLSLTGFCLAGRDLSYDEAVNALDGNICRCTGYASIRNAARALCDGLARIDRTPARRAEAMIAAGVLPDYFRSIPGRLAELKADPAAAAKDAVIVAGGTDLFVQRPEQLRESELCFLSARPELSYVREEAGFINVGGAASIEDFRVSPAVRAHFPSLEADLLLHSSAILRNKATLAGNIANASPIGDATIILLALGARLVITGGRGAREVPLEKFYLGYKKTDLACGELISAIKIPLPRPGSRFHFEKVSNRTTLDIAAVNSAMLLNAGDGGAITDIRVSVGGVGPVPMLLGGLEALRGMKPGAEAGEALAAIALKASRPIDDIRGSAEYKRLLAGQLMKAHFRAPAAKEAI